MALPPLPSVSDTTSHFGKALRAATCDDRPYRHWSLTEVLPDNLCVGILALPIAPPSIDDCYGVRDKHNDKRSFFTPLRRAQFPVCALLAEAMQRPETARAFAETCKVDVEGGFVRIEYIQDTNGAWLEPHRDIPEKIFSMVIYLCTGPDAKDWGTDIYDADRCWVGRSSAEFNSSVIFVPGPDTWHGFEPRPIVGVRRLMEINYVRSTWRDRDQLAFPDQAVTLS